MNREIPFDKNAMCDDCGCKGAYDFMGNYFCDKCASKAFNTCNCREDCDCDDVDDDNNVDHTDDLNE